MSALLHWQNLYKSRSLQGYFLKNVINSPILFNNYKVSTFEYGFSFTNINSGNFTVFVGIDIVLHFHGLQDNDNLAFLHGITHIDFDVKDNTWQRRFYTWLACWSSSRFYNWSSRGSVGAALTGRTTGLTATFGAFFHFYFVGSTVHFYVSDVVFNISNSNFICVTVDFVFYILSSFYLY